MRHKDEQALREELAQYKIQDWKPFSILYIAEAKLEQLPPRHGFIPKARYWMYLAQELLIEGEPEDWTATDLFRMIAGHTNRDQRIRAAKRVLEEYRQGKEKPKWRGRKEGDEETFG
jgi:hypothetical protein